jgi:hypothetical protein
MWSLEAIIEMNNGAGHPAQRCAAKDPVRLGTLEEVLNLTPPLPYLASACGGYDQSWERVDRLLVAVSGLGAPQGDAMTIGQMREWLAKLHREHGPLRVALDEQGPTQGWLVVWAEGSH